MYPAGRLYCQSLLGLNSPPGILLLPLALVLQAALLGLGRQLLLPTLAL